MNIPNYKTNPFDGVNALTELDLLTDGVPLERARMVSKRWVKAVLSPGNYGQRRIQEHQHMLGACMRARVEAAAEHMCREEEESYDLLLCSFCGKDEHQVTRIIRAPDQEHDLWLTLASTAAECGHPVTVTVAVAICDECVAVCAEVIAEHKKGEAATTGSAHNS